MMSPRAKEGNMSRKQTSLSWLVGGRLALLPGGSQTQVMSQKEVILRGKFQLRANWPV